MTLNKMTSEKHNVGEGENAGNQHFLLFKQSISALLKTNFTF